MKKNKTNPIPVSCIINTENMHQTSFQELSERRSDGTNKVMKTAENYNAKYN
jgi:hypothetical protein